MRAVMGGTSESDAVKERRRAQENGIERVMLSEVREDSDKSDQMGVVTKEIERVRIWGGGNGGVWEGEINVR